MVFSDQNQCNFQKKKKTLFCLKIRINYLVQIELRHPMTSQWRWTNLK